MKNDHSCYVHSSSHWQFTSKAPSPPTHGPLYWDLSLGRSVLPPVAPLLILRQEAGLEHFLSYLPEALSPMLEKLASWSVLISIPLWNIYSKSWKYHNSFWGQIYGIPFDYLDMQTGLSPLSLRFTYSIFSFGYHWTSSSGDTELKKISFLSVSINNYYGFCQKVGHPPFPQHTCIHEVTKITMKSWWYLKFQLGICAFSLVLF